MAISSLTFDDVSSYHMTTLELKRLVEFLDEVDVRATLFVVPNKLKDKEFVDELKRAAARRHELAMHGVNHVKNEFGVLYPVSLPLPVPAFETQRRRLEEGIKNMVKLTGQNPVGFRAPYLLHSNATLRALSSLGFHYDSSLSLFKPACLSRFRIRWAQKIKPFMSKGVLEICVSGDYMFNLKNDNFHDSLKKAFKDFISVTSSNGVFVTVCHPQRLNNLQYNFLKKLTHKISKNSDFYGLCDIAKMYSKHT